MGVLQARAGRPRLRVAFSTPALRRCHATTAVARIGDLATLVAVSVHLFGRGGAGAVAAFGVVRAVAPALTVPLVTSAAGRWAPARGLWVCAAVAAGGSAVTAALVATDGALVALYAVAGVTAVALCCLRPLVIALLPSCISCPRELVATNAAAALVDNLSTVAGPLMAGAAAATLGPAWALAVCSGLLAADAVAVLTMRAGSAPLAGPGTRTWLHDIGQGLVILARGPVRLVVALSTAQTFVRGALNVLVVVLAIEALEMGEPGVGLLLGAIGVGGVVGFPVAVRIVAAVGTAAALCVALVLWGAPVALAAVAPGAVVALALFTLIGVGNDLVDISADTLFQRLVPHGSLLRALGAFEAVMFAGMAAGAVVAERMLATWGLRPTLVVIGSLLPLTAAATWGALARVDRQLHGRDADLAVLQVDGILSPLVMSTIDHLAQGMDHEEFEAGETIICKGDIGDRYLVIEQGEVEIVDDGALLTVLGPGDGFGEVALLEEVPRNASAVARSPVLLRSLRREDFLSAVRGDHRAHLVARRRVDERRRAPDLASVPAPVPVPVPVPVSTVD